MSVHRSVTIYIACDRCPNSLKVEGVDTILEGVEQARAQGWVLVGVRGKWPITRCPTCEAEGIVTFLLPANLNSPSPDPESSTGASENE